MDNAELVQAAGLAFAYHYHRDLMNAAAHAGEPRFSPITFALCDGLMGAGVNTNELQAVSKDAGRYPLDGGR